jgi:hypothetical protein
MGLYTVKSGADGELRKVTERRTREQKWRHDRRVRPDRRLNNISVERIPFSEISFNPAIREALCRGDNRNQAKGTPRNEYSLVCKFKNKPAADIDLRKVTERRTQQQMCPYNRRVHPDRRLSNISVEWITY